MASLPELCIEYHSNKATEVINLQNEAVVL